MPFSAIPKSLIVYSSPGSLSRLRIDKEHNAIDQVLAKRNLPPTVVKRIHAATIMDVGAALLEQDYELVLFSCHGAADGLCLEPGPGHAFISWHLLSQTLLSAAPSLSVVILNACHSDTAEESLRSTAPFLIMMDGTADDAAAVTFSQHFFEEFYRSTSVDQAFRQAIWALEATGKADLLKPVLIRRQPSGDSVIQACFVHRQDSVFIDLAKAEESISRLPIARHEFLALLTRKISVHSWIFRVERERAVIPIGQFFGVFSWQNANDVVHCHAVLQLKPDALVEDCLGWTRLMVLYNDLRSERYRVLPDPAAPENKGMLAETLQRIKGFCGHTLCSEEVAAAAKKLARQQYIVTVSTVQVQCDLAVAALQSSDLSRVVNALETAISSIHDLVDHLTASVTVSIPEPQNS
jgi:hypothetical protein